MTHLAIAAWFALFVVGFVAVVLAATGHLH